MPEYTSLGIGYPLPIDKIKDVGVAAKLADDIRRMAFTADAAIIAEGTRVMGAAIHDAAQKYGGLPSRVAAAEQKNSQQDGRLGDLEALRPTKSVRLEGGKWVWDLAGATHYVLIDHSGAPAVRATPWPKPNPNTPEFTW